MKYLLFMMMLYLLSGCSGFLENRSFVDQMNKENDQEFFEAGRDFEITSGDSGQVRRTKMEILARTPSSIRERKQFQFERALQYDLRSKENNLTGIERLKYQRIKHSLGSRTRKLYYLSLSSSGKKQYLRSLGVQDLKFINNKRKANSRYVHLQNSHSSAVSVADRPNKLFGLPDLSQGMGKEEVKGLWGNPEKVEVAGNPTNQNEKWIFFQNGGSNIIFFENGQVQGWELH